MDPTDEESRSLCLQDLIATGAGRRFSSLPWETAKLYTGQQYSIAELTHGTKLTRQAVTKHLRVLERARMVHGKHVGRENLFEFAPRPVDEMKRYLEFISGQWDGALERLKAFVEH